MFETTIEKDVERARSKTEREQILEQIYQKFHDEFVQFIDVLTKNGIAHTLFNLEDPEETKKLWKEFSLKNQSFFNEVRTWAKKRDEYMNTWETIPLFIDEDVSEYYLEIGLLMYIVKDDILLSEEDFDGDKHGEEFSNKFTDLLKSSPNILIKAAGHYFDCEGFESMTEENIFEFFN